MHVEGSSREGNVYFLCFKVVMAYKYTLHVACSAVLCSYSMCDCDVCACGYERERMMRGFR